MGSKKQQLGARLTDKSAEFRVWAPFAKSVAVVGDFSNWEEVALTAEADGNWSAVIPGAKAGQNYKFHINTGKMILERNDPRARQLTDSDTGASVLVDDDFDWEDMRDFPVPSKRDQIIYELHVGTFNRPDASTTGTFYTAIDKLDYLKDLGVNMIELMPVTSMASSNGWGYAPNYIFSVENNYGGRRGMLEFVKACHKRGIGVVLDVVYNHFFSKTDLWRYDGWHKGRYGGIYFYNDERGKTPWGGRPDYGRPEVREFILDNITMWFAEYRIDGLRVDSTIYMRNTLGQNNDPAHDIPEAWSLLGEITKRSREIKPDAMLIAEDCAGNEYLTKPVEAGGCGFDAQWELGYPHVLRDALGLTPNTQQTLDGVGYELAHIYNGDPFQKIIFSDSHDTAANGSVRLNEAAAPGNAESVFAREQSILAQAVVLTSPGVPMLLQGQEFMQEGSFNDWQMLEWEKTEQFAGIVLAHKHLIDLRRNRYGNTAGLLGSSVAIFHHDTVNRVVGYHRWDTGGPQDDVLVIVNFSNQEFETEYNITLPLQGTWKVRFNSSWKGYSPEFHEIIYDEVTTDEHGQAPIKLAPYSVLILSQD